MKLAVIFIFVLGYLLIALEHYIKINKTAIALLTGILCWALFALSGSDMELVHSAHFESLSEIASILFFLMGAMTIVELIDAHDGFRLITDRITTRNARKLLWVMCWVAFVFSAVLDNLTTSIVMISLARKLIPEKKQRWLFAGMIVIAANAGGAWSPIGDVTTTMLWIEGRISSAGIVQAILLPSILCLLVPLIYITFRIKGEVGPPPGPGEPATKGGRIMFFAGVGSLLFVPVFKAITHLPPYLGMLMGLGVLWTISEQVNPDIDDVDRKKFSAASALSRIDVSSVLFFFGILLAVAALQSMQILQQFSAFLFKEIGNETAIVSLFGVLSAVIDNVPLVAASIGMFPTELYPIDHTLWEYLAYCSGTGGSLLIIGSAAGVAVMGMENIDFLWYVRRISLLALLGYVSGALFYQMTLSMF